LQTQRRSKFCLLAPAKLFQLLPLFGGVDPAGPGLEWAPTNRNLPSKPTPRSNICLLAPALFSLQTLPFGGVDPASPGLGWAPSQNQIFQQIPSKEQLLFAGPRPITNPAGNFRRGHCAGYPWGWHFGLPPGYISFL
jgi:hypothetical protein